MFCDKKTRDYTFSRDIVSSALAVYIKHGLSVKTPVQCLDLSTTGEAGEYWTQTHGALVHVISSDTPSHECNHNPHRVTPGKYIESKYALIEQTDFNFLYIECTTEGSSYFDCAFRKVARNGLIAISTIDDPALYGRPAEPALRCYGGNIVRTFYSVELAVRLILAAMARSAARFSKRIDVLLATAIKSSVTILVKVTKGAESAVVCLKNVKTLAHCSVCEERAFLPDNDGYVLEDVKKYISCDCGSHNVGRTVMALGPLWAGAIGSPTFVDRMLSVDNLSVQLATFLQDLNRELRCESCTKVKSEKQQNDVSSPLIDTSTDLLSALKRKHEEDQNELEVERKRPCLRLESDPEPAPEFYYNLHKHKPKGCQKLLKADKIISAVQQMGYRASRTLFDRAAVKTNCPLRVLQSALYQDSENK